MANMTELASIVELYNVAMTSLLSCINKLSLNVFQIRYEDTVMNIETEVSGVLDFLGLEWENGLHNFQKTVLDSRKINTPSYSQVVEPLNDDAINRWMHYREYLSDYFPIIEPWVDEFKYTPLKSL